MQFSVRNISGPAVIAVVAAAALAVDRRYVTVPDLAPLFVGLAACAAALGGTGAGLAGAAIAVGVTALFAGQHQTPGLGVVGMAMLTLGAATAALATGWLRSAMERASRRERARHATARRLAAALDQSRVGIVLLDADTRAEFINRAFRDLFAVPDALADSHPPFIALMYHGRDSHAYALPDDEIDSFIARRTEMIRAGDPTPFDISLANGTVLRLSCTALPDGGRMLSYTVVTDLVRRGDDPAHADHYLAMRGADVFATGRLNAAE